VACGTTLALAERTFDRATREDNPAWLGYFDEAYLNARMAQCFRDLGEAAHAAQYAQRLLNMDGRYVRGRAFNLSLLAAARAAQREPEQACQAGRQALDLTVRLSSARSVRSVRDVVRRLRPYAALPAVLDFTTEVQERLPAAAAHAARRCW
jgi:tetratricopeptide (TPR) repeat protein